MHTEAIAWVPAQMQCNPSMGDQIYHTHSAGMWMVDYRYMYGCMNGLQAGTPPRIGWRAPF
jgi:hypothetical protein